MQEKRKLLLIALGVTDKWNPIEAFRQLKNDVPLARIVGFGVPMQLSRETIKDWDREARATLGMYGWRGASFEMHGWTMGEAYLKFRDSLDRGPFAPIIFPPDQSMSNEAAVVCAKGDGQHLPPLIVCSEYSVVDSLQPDNMVLPFATDASDEGTLGVFMSDSVDIPKLTEVLTTLQTEAQFIDPIANARHAKGPFKVQLKETTL